MLQTKPRTTTIITLLCSASVHILLRMKTYSFLTIPICLSLLCGCSKREQDVPPPPNLLLISIDTLRADHLSCYGYKRNTSARIDKLAADGILFENCFSVSCKTTPSHMSIMTGLYPQEHNVYMWSKNAQGPCLGKTLSPAIPTLAEILKQKGYHNVAFTGGANVAAKIGFGRGFEIYREDDNIEAAVEWLQKNCNKPFFMFYHTYYTHDPYLPPPPYDKKFNPEYSGEIPNKAAFLKTMKIDETEDWHGQWDRLHQYYWSKVNLNDKHDLFHLKALYDGCINNVDDNFIGGLLDSLQSQGQLDNTLIIITSDHGEEFLEHGRTLHDSLYKEVTHVPLIMRLPEKIPAGLRVRQIVRSIDIMPTVLDLLDIKAEVGMRGISLLPTTANTNLNLTAYSDFNDFAPPYIESLRNASQFLLMDQRLSLAKNQNALQKSGITQFYNTDNDPAEINNIIETAWRDAERMKTTMHQLRIDFAKFRATTTINYQPSDLPMDKKNIKRLKSLGYIR